MGVRFAPSPTGRFHIGNLRTAWISHQWARALGVPWVVRFEDIDAPRVVAGAQEEQLADLGVLELVPDQVLVQSGFANRHLELFERARAEGVIYPCSCSRKDLQEVLARSASAPHGEPPLYSGQCRHSFKASQTAHPTLAWRFRSPEEDGSQDFIVGRTRAKGDGFVPAYNWACAIDDFDGAYALLVRAWDLEHVAIQQRAIQGWLKKRGVGTQEFPAVFHTSWVTANDGARLEKRTRGVTLPELVTAGNGSAAILEKFAVGFELNPADYAVSRLWGETRRKVSLGELGF